MVTSARVSPGLGKVCVQSLVSTSRLNIGGHLITMLHFPPWDLVGNNSSTDTTVRLWDIRKSSSCLCSLDLHNSNSPPLAETNTAHTRTVNGISFTSDGLYLITSGHDDKMRLWNLHTGQNTLTNYGTMIHNQFVHSLSPLISPLSTGSPHYVFHPSDDHSILMFDLLDGSLVKRLTGSYGRITSLAWRPRTQVCLQTTFFIVQGAANQTIDAYLCNRLL